jgi:hypothetical protein
MSIVGSGGVVHVRNGRITIGRGCENYSNPPHKVFRRRFILRRAPPLDLAAPPVAIVLLVVDVVPPHLGHLDVNMPVDV